MMGLMEFEESEFKPENRNHRKKVKRLLKKTAVSKEALILTKETFMKESKIIFKNYSEIFAQKCFTEISLLIRNLISKYSQFLQNASSLIGKNEDDVFGADKLLDLQTSYRLIGHTKFDLFLNLIFK